MYNDICMAYYIETYYMYATAKDDKKIYGSNLNPRAHSLQWPIRVTS